MLPEPIEALQLTLEGLVADHAEQLDLFEGKEECALKRVVDVPVIAAGGMDDPDTSRALASGVAYLLSSQEPDSGWVDEHWTGTGFPGVFYLRYHLYACYFPLQALATFGRVLEMKCDAERAA